MVTNINKKWLNTVSQTLALCVISFKGISNLFVRIVILCHLLQGSIQHLLKKLKV